MVVGKRVNDFLSVEEDVLGLLALGGIQELVSSYTTLATVQQSTMTAYTTLSNNFSTLLGLNPSLMMS